MWGYETNSGCVLHQHLLTDMNQGWCQTQISILLTAHLCLINDWAGCCRGNPAERPSGVHSVSSPSSPLPTTLTLSSDTQESLPFRLDCRIKCGLLRDHTTNRRNIMCCIHCTSTCKTINFCICLAVSGYTSIARHSLWALGIKRLPCSQVKRAPLFTNGTPANDLDSLKTSALSRTLKCIIMHLFQWNCHYSVG